MILLPVDGLDRIDAERDYVRLWTSSTSYLLHDTLTRIEGRLDAGAFVRLRRSVIVRQDTVRALRHEGPASGMRS